MIVNSPDAFSCSTKSTFRAPASSNDLPRPCVSAPIGPCTSDRRIQPQTHGSRTCPNRPARRSLLRPTLLRPPPPLCLHDPLQTCHLPPWTCRDTTPPKTRSSSDCESGPPCGAPRGSSQNDAVGPGPPVTLPVAGLQLAPVRTKMQLSIT